MDDDFDLRRFNHQCRLFPLPNLVFFPHNVLPLHVFEPRYRRMTEDALAGDGFVAMVRQRPPTHGGLDALGSPPIDTIGCLGKIIQHERTQDGRFFFLLAGLKRVRLRRELATDKPYRVAEAEIIEDAGTGEPEEPGRSELITLFRSTFESQGTIDPVFADLLESAVPLGVLADILSNAVSLSPDIKQSLLAEAHVGRRVELLLHEIGRMNQPSQGQDLPNQTFPPPFSAN